MQESSPTNAKDGRGEIREEPLAAQVRSGFQQLERGETSDLSMDDLKAIARHQHREHQSSDSPSATDHA